jgi:murein L,D-transpeptidase YcbB/YkuD
VSDGSRTPPYHLRGTPHSQRCETRIRTGLCRPITASARSTACCPTPLWRSLPTGPAASVAWSSAGLVRYLDDLNRGRIKVRLGSGGVPPVPPPDWAAAIDSALAGDSLAGLLEHAAPALTQYRNLRRALDRYRRLGLVPDSAQRVRKIELALELLRWLPAIPTGPFIAVKVPAFQLFGFDSIGGDGAPSFTSRVVVGRALATETPALYELMRYVEFRPSSIVPRSIVGSEILPRLRNDPDYLRRLNMELIERDGRSLGDDVTGELRDRLARGELRLRQRPGPANALGLVKFVFPNAASVYLHDTPDTGVFGRSRRDLSHGCIRVADAEGLANWVLRGEPQWTADSMHAAMHAAVTRRAMLRRPMPVAIVYATAVATPSGEVRFFEDIYGHDRELENALAALRREAISVRPPIRSMTGRHV